MKLRKGTSTARPAQRRPGRTYNDACGAAHALDLVGERWALLVMRELMFGPKRFSDLKADLPGISARVLTQRLQGLESTGLLTHHRQPPPSAALVYELTRWGYESEPIFQSLGRWATRSPLHDPRLPISKSSVLLSFRTMFDPRLAAGLNAKVGLRMGGEAFLATLGHGSIAIGRAPLDGADVVLDGDPGAIAAAVYGGISLPKLIAEGELRITGDRALARRFIRLFPLPGKAAIQ